MQSLIYGASAFCVVYTHPVS